MYNFIRHWDIFEMNIELEGSDLEIGHIIQITKDDLNVLYPVCGSIMVVTEIKEWGVKAEINCQTGIMPFRVKYGDFIVVGKVYNKNPEKEFIEAQTDLPPEFTRINFKVSISLS